MLLIEIPCAHDVEPISDDPDWGRCKRCGANDFPMTDAAAYGPVNCSVCHDMGLVPVEVPNGFADGPCPNCGSEFAALGVTP